MMGIRKSQSHIKPWEECTRQQQHNRKKVLAHDIKGALYITCESKGFEAHSVKHQNINTEIIEILGPFSDRENLLCISDQTTNLLTYVYIKNTFSISYQAFYELSLLALNLPSLIKLRNYHNHLTLNLR